MTPAVLAALLLCGCGLELTSREDIGTNVNTVNPSPTPSATTTTDPGITATVTGTVSGGNLTLSYALLNVTSNGTPQLELLDYDPCLFAETHGDATYPEDFNTLILILDTINAAPGPGVYTDTAGTNSTSNMMVDPNSSYGSISNCTGSWTGVNAGTTVTIDSINTSAGSAAGTLSVVLDSNVGALTGQFSAVECPNVASSNFSGDGNICSTIQ